MYLRVTLKSINLKLTKNLNSNQPHRSITCHDDVMFRCNFLHSGSNIRNRNGKLEIYTEAKSREPRYHESLSQNNDRRGLEIQTLGQADGQHGYGGWTMPRGVAANNIGVKGRI